MVKRITPQKALEYIILMDNLALEAALHRSLKFSRWNKFKSSKCSLITPQWVAIETSMQNVIAIPQCYWVVFCTQIETFAFMALKTTVAGPLSARM